MVRGWAWGRTSLNKDGGSKGRRAQALTAGLGKQDNAEAAAGDVLLDTQQPPQADGHARPGKHVAVGRILHALRREDWARRQPPASTLDVSLREIGMDGRGRRRSKWEGSEG
jgi:hypothetical protein